MAPSMPESDAPQKARRVGESDEGNVDLPSRHLIGRWFVAFGGVVVVESPFGVDASLTVVFAGVLAARHHQATVRFCRDDRGRANRLRWACTAWETAADYPDAWCRSGRWAQSRSACHRVAVEPTNPKKS